MLPNRYYNVAKAHFWIWICVWASIDLTWETLLDKGFQGMMRVFGIIKMLKIGFGGKGLN
jgi:hypothetical protein